jgi:hypothetical protein
MRIPITPSQAVKAHRVLLGFYNECNDPEIADLLVQLEAAIKRRPQEALCLGCGQPLPVEPTSRERTYCNDQCRQEAYRQNRTKRNRRQQQELQSKDGR